MCNRYSVASSKVAICDIAKATVDTSGNLAGMPAIIPDQMAPVVMTRLNDSKRQLLMMRWGFPSPIYGLGAGIATNVRNTKSHWWTQYLRAQHRCLVPVTSFCEYDRRSGKAVPIWFALDETRPLFFSLASGAVGRVSGVRGAPEPSERIP